MSTGTDCRVYVDGVRLPDGCYGVDPGAPTALSPLQVAWGRDTTVDQPPASTCTFDVMDPAGGDTFLGRFHTGSLIDVTATGMTYPDPTRSTFVDPGFESSAVASTTNAVAAASTTRFHSGARSLALRPTNPVRAWSAQLPPAPYANPGDPPGAWEAIPTTSPGQTWSVGAWLWAPVGVEVEVRPVLFTGPTANAGTAGSLLGTLVGDGAWHFLGGDVITSTAGQWVGMQLDTYPASRRWLDVPGSWAAQPSGWRWIDEALVYVDDVAVLAPEGGTSHTVLVFEGRVTDLAASWDDEAGCPVLSVAAADFTADLDNRDVGDEPWAVEAMSARFNRIITLSGQTVTAQIDSTVAGKLVSWRDVDKQPAAGLLRELATTVDAVMWPAVHQSTGAYLRVEDASTRAPLYRFEKTGTYVTIVTAGGLALSACDVLREPVEFIQNVSDIVTRAAVSWLEQGTDDDGNPATTEHTETVIAPDLEVAWGARRISVTTQLQSQTDAIDVADRLLARLSSANWRAGGFSVDDDDIDDANLLLSFLDGTSRIGQPLRVVDLPDWSPVGDALPVYVEGGALNYEDGRWLVELTVSRAAGLGTSATWAQMPSAWRWVDFDPSISWADARGVAGPAVEVAA